MARVWKVLDKTAEECGELVVELMKLRAFPDGKHPGRRRSVILSTEDELADVMNAIEFFIDFNHLDRARIERRMKTKRKKFEKWWGKTPKTKAKKSSSKAKKR